MDCRKNGLALFMACIFSLFIISEGCSQAVNKLELNKNWQFRKVGDLRYYSAYIPGTVHLDLYKNHIISDPYYGCNEQQQQWIENENWEYRLFFNLPDSIFIRNQINLVFEGLDTYASIALNGKQILQTDNMFRSWKVDIKPYLKKENNELMIIFESAVNKGKKMAQTLQYTLPGEERVFTRKAAYQYGWDWGPRFVTCGIYKPLYIESWNIAKIENIQLIQKSLNTNLAHLNFIFELNASKEGIYGISVIDNITDSIYIEKKLPLNKGLNKVTLNIEIQHPHLWWTNGLGASYLYHFNCSIKEGNDFVDTKIVNIGLRTIEILQENDSIGKSFYVKLNGIPVFMKGANYIPADNFITRVDSNKYAAIIKNAVDANMNMLRVWGGGNYENNIFYDLCDKNGILIWQDFMFACAMYPGDSSFLNNVKNEAMEVIKRLRNHPCLALWCGNNEIDEGWHNWSWQKQYKYAVVDSTQIWNDYSKIFFKILPKAIAANDSNRFYWASSPSFGWGRKESLLQGDVHYWGVWWGMEPFEMYKTKVGRFMSEYGFQGMPSYSTLAKIAPLDSLSLNNLMVQNHQKHPTGYQTIKTYMERDYKMPLDFKNYIYVSQLLQGEGIKIAIEAHRRAKPICMGTLYWQLNDCWPVTSWSSSDYFNNWKALHYFVKKLYDDLLISVNQEGNNYNIYLISDKLANTKGTLFITIANFDGKLLFEKQIPVIIGKNSSQIYYSLNNEIISNSTKTKCIFIAIL